MAVSLPLSFGSHPRYGLAMKHRVITAPNDEGRCLHLELTGSSKGFQAIDAGVGEAGGRLPNHPALKSRQSSRKRGNLRRGLVGPVDRPLQLQPTSQLCRLCRISRNPRAPPEPAWFSGVTLTTRSSIKSVLSEACPSTLAFRAMTNRSRRAMRKDGFDWWDRGHGGQRGTAGGASCSAPRTSSGFYEADLRQIG